MKRELEVRPSVAITLVTLVALMCSAAWILAISIPEMFFAGFGLTSLLIVVSPFLILKRYDLFSPWTIVLLTVGTGCAAPAIATALSWPDEQYLSSFSLLGQEPEYFYYPSGVLLLGFACMTIGYTLLPSDVLKRYEMGRSMSPSRLFLTSFLCAGLALAAAGAFIVSTGGGSSSVISGKRTTIRTLDVKEDDGFSQYGYLRAIASLSNVVFIGLLSFWTTRQPSLTRTQLLVLGAVFLLACVIPFYSSSRASVAWLFLAAMGVLYYTHQPNLPLKLGVFTVLAVTIFSTMSILRNPNAEFATEIPNLARNFIFSRNGPELAKTAHIINGIPDKLDFQYGKTIAVWLIAPIPREVYPDKPLIHYGPIIGRAIYGNNVSGVPPGLVGEMYLNFHISGVMVGCLFFGWGIRKLYETLFAISGDFSIIISVYLFAFLPLPFKILGSSFGSGILAFVNLFMILAVVYFCSAPNEGHPSHSS